MSTTEQNISQKSENSLKKVVFITGTGLAKKHLVKKEITYKEITLIIGIAVAVLVAFTLFIWTPEKQASIIEPLSLPKFITPLKPARSILELLKLIF